MKEEPAILHGYVLRSVSTPFDDHHQSGKNQHADVNGPIPMHGDVLEDVLKSWGTGGTTTYPIKLLTVSPVKRTSHYRQSENVELPSIFILSSLSQSWNALQQSSWIELIFQLFFCVWYKLHPTTSVIRSNTGLPWGFTWWSLSGSVSSAGSSVFQSRNPAEKPHRNMKRAWKSVGAKYIQRNRNLYFCSA